jgi:hypothetical protein
MLKPNYIQLEFYQFDEMFFNNYTNTDHYLMPKEVKQYINAYMIFSRYYSQKTIDIMKKQIKKK